MLKWEDSSQTTLLTVMIFKGHVIESTGGSKPGSSHPFPGRFYFVLSAMLPFAGNRYQNKCKWQVPLKRRDPLPCLNLGVFVGSGLVT